MKRIASIISLCSTLTFATWNYFPVPEGKGLDFRLDGVYTSFSVDGASFDYSFISTEFGFRAYANDFEFYLKSPSFFVQTRSSEGGSSSSINQSNFLLGGRYQFNESLAGYAEWGDSKEGPFGNDFLEGGMQFSHEFAPTVSFGSQLGIRHFFGSEPEEGHYVRMVGNEIIVGVELDKTAETSLTFAPLVTLFFIFDTQILLTDAVEYNVDYDEYSSEYLKRKSQVGDFDFQVKLGVRAPRIWMERLTFESYLKIAGYDGAYLGESGNEETQHGAYAVSLGVAVMFSH